MKIKMMSGDHFEISEEEAKNIPGKTGLTFVPSLKGFLNLSSVESILPDDIANKNLKEGYLHDGEKVIKRYGIWVDANNPLVKIDPHYYPEVARDEVYAENPKNKLTVK